MAYTNAVYYIDLVSGSDTTRSTITGIVFSNPSGTTVLGTKVAHGLVTGAVITVSGCTQAYANSAWKITWDSADTFTLDTALWASFNGADVTGDAVPFGGGSWADAWQTITSGATAERIQAGDEIRVSKTADPVSIGNGKWEDCPNTGFAPTTVNISSSTNASPIEITTSANHNLNTGDVVLVNSHPTNYTANGNWQITYVSDTKFTLDNSIGVGTGSSQGTIRKVNSKAVILATEQTKNIVTTQGGWTAAGDSTVDYVALSGTACKFGYLLTRVTVDSSPQTSTLQAYKAITSTDFSAYQKLSFWCYSQNFTIVANSWYLALCSDTAGATPVDVFKIPAIASSTRDVPLTIVKDGGGNLGSAIQSVALYTDTVAPSANLDIRIDNIIACTTSGLSLQSLISKNGSAQGGTEGYYGIQSINGKVVVLDNDTNTVSTAGQGYSGASETVTTYIRETFKTAMAASSTTVVNTINDSGTFGNLIAYEFGYEVGTTNQNGETFLDGLNGYGLGIYAVSKQHNSLNWFSAVRYNYGLQISTGGNNIIYTVTNLNNNSNGGLFFSNSNNNIIYELTNLNNNTNYGFYLNAYNNAIYTITNANNNNSYGLDIYYSQDNKINTITNLNNNTTYGIYFDSSYNNKLMITSSKGSSGFYSNTGTNYFYDSTFNQSVEFASITSPTNNWIWSLNHDATAGNNWGFTYQATVNWQTSTKHSTEVGAWKTAITGSTRNTGYPVKLKIAEVAWLTASAAVTVKAWVKKDHATDIACRLKVYADTANGITEAVVTKASDTDWQELTLTFTPTYAGVTELFFENWYVTASSNTYIGALTITQA